MPSRSVAETLLLLVHCQTRRGGMGKAERLIDTVIFGCPRFVYGWLFGSLGKISAHHLSARSIWFWCFGWSTSRSEDLTTIVNCFWNRAVFKLIHPPVIRSAVCWVRVWRVLNFLGEPMLGFGGSETLGWFLILLVSYFTESFPPPFCFTNSKTKPNYSNNTSTNIQWKRTKTQTQQHAMFMFTRILCSISQTLYVLKYSSNSGPDTRLLFLTW